MSTMGRPCRFPTRARFFRADAMPVGVGRLTVSTYLRRFAILPSVATTLSPTLPGTFVDLKISLIISVKKISAFPVRMPGPVLMLLSAYISRLQLRSSICQSTVPPINGALIFGSTTRWVSLCIFRIMANPTFQFPSLPMSPSSASQFFVMIADSPEILLLKLRWCRGVRCLTIRRSLPAHTRTSTYVVEDLHYLRTSLQDANIPYCSDMYDTYRGVRWPQDLTTIPGLWQNPLNFTFSALTILNLQIYDAVLWLIPILAATDADAPLRRVLIGQCAGWDECLQPFPFQALDEQLGSRPEAKLLLAWALDDGKSDGFIDVFKSRLPRLGSNGRIGILYAGGPHCKCCTSCCYDS